MKIKEVEVLQEKYQTPKSEYDGRFSKTAQFMIPAIGIKTTHPTVFKFFKNAYLNDVNHINNYERPIFMLFGTPDFKNKEWIQVYTTLIKSQNYITEYDIGIKDNQYLIMLVFGVPEEYKMDYLNFKLGNYSLFSDKYKKFFPKYLNPSNKDKKINIHWQIINRDPQLAREVEKEFNLDEGVLDSSRDIWEKPRKEREFYGYSATKE